MSLRHNLRMQAMAHLKHVLQLKHNKLKEKHQFHSNSQLDQKVNHLERGKLKSRTHLKRLKV